MSTGNGARIASRSVHNMVLATEAFVKSQVAALSHDASHDWRYSSNLSVQVALPSHVAQLLLLTHCTIHCSHIDRVRKMALVLAKEEGDSVSLDTAAYASATHEEEATILLPQDLEVVELASLLHDVQDWKYSGSVTAGAATIQVKGHTSAQCRSVRDCMHDSVACRSSYASAAILWTNKKQFWMSSRALASRQAFHLLAKVLSMVLHPAHVKLVSNGVSRQDAPLGYLVGLVLVPFQS